MAIDTQENMAKDQAALKQLQHGINAQFEAIYQANDEKSLALAREGLTKYGSLIGARMDPVTSILSLTGQHVHHMIVVIALDLKLFEIIAAKPSTTLDEIAQQTGANARFLKRILRVLTAIGFFQQNEVDVWQATPLTHAATAPPVQAWITIFADKRFEMSAQFPKWLKKHNYQTSWLEDDNIAKQVYGSELWTYYATNLEEGKLFDTAMMLQESFPLEQVPPYPFAYKMSGIKQDPEAVFLVDIGGGEGQAIETLKKTYPDIAALGRCVLQDRPPVIEKINQSKAREIGFEPTVHDFFTTQPVKGAKYYHFRRVLHDWNDDKLLTILEALRPAFEPGYSKLLIHEAVLSEISPGPAETLMDISMMTVCDGCERSESEWQDVLSKAGFKIDRVLRADVGVTAIIEASLAGA